MASALKTMLAVLLMLVSLLPLQSHSQSEPPPISNEEIEQLVAPIALYPDALVAQILMASTYPLEVVSAARWVTANPNVKGEALEAAMQQQPWDPSVKALAALPQVLNMMNDKLDMTQKLGDAFLAQQKDVLDAVQRLRARAQAAGNLKSGNEQVVSTEQQGSTTIIKIEPASPQVVYVPTYNPTVIYGAWPYPAYPPYYYYPPGYVAGTALFSFAVGVAVGNAMWGHCNWRGGNVNINVNRYNSFNRTTINNVNWQHNVNHRRNVPYNNPVAAQRYGQLSPSQQAQARQAYRGYSGQAPTPSQQQRVQQRTPGQAQQQVQQRTPGQAQQQVQQRTPGQAQHQVQQRAASGQAQQRATGQAQPQQRMRTTDQAGSRAAPGGAGAFDGIGNGRQTRDSSARGAASRNAGARASGRRR